MIDKVKQNDCLGCLACYNICPKNAIELKSNKNGFIMPKINFNLCISCELCSKACPTINPIPRSNQLRAFGAISTNNEQRMSSQSGGAFSALATQILLSKGIVYGAAITEDLSVKQIRITDINELKHLQGSKYVQSNVDNTFRSVKKDLLEGNIVLYSGTSCMIEGLILYLQQLHVSHDKLITIDLICHGVNSPLILKEHLHFVERENNSKIKSYIFRNKQYGWNKSIETYELNEKTITSNYFSDLFYSDVILRENCHHCLYMDIANKKSDITLGDFWGNSKVIPGFHDDNKGISLILSHNEKGLKLIESATLDKIEVNPEVAIKYNMHIPAKIPVHKKKFWSDYHKKGYKYALRKWSIYGGIIFKIRRKILRKLRRW